MAARASRPQSAPAGDRHLHGGAGAKRDGGRQAGVQSAPSLVRPSSAPPPRSGKKSSRRQCKTCGYSWLDTLGKPQCPKCFGKMDDGFTFMDTEAGRKMKEAMEIAKLKQRKLETLQRKVLSEAKEKGAAKSRAEWQGFKAGLENLELARTAASGTGIFTQDVDPAKQKQLKAKAEYRKLAPVLGLSESCSEKELMSAYNAHLLPYARSRGLKEINYRAIP